MTIAAKHMDPIVGVDIHIILIPTPAGPVPTPLPNPFVGMVLDPFDYIPFIGATVKINGLPRGQAGTGGVALPPHLPLGGPFGPPPPGNEAEIFMGSATVASDGDAQSFLGMPALTCQSIGMPAPPRMKGQPAKSLVLPTSVVLSIPMGMLVLIGGPPTISLMALGMRAIMALAGPLAALLRRAQRGTGRIGRAMRAATARARRAGSALADFLRLGPRARSRVNRAICFVTGHPVDIATGKVFTDKVDLTLAGPMPFKWERVWYSTSTYDGPLGHGWHHSYDAGLYVTDEVVLYRTPDGRLVDFPPLKEGTEHFDRTERLTLIRTPGKYDGEYTVRTIDRVTYRFRELRKSARVHPSRPRDDRFDPREHVLTGIHDASGQGTTFGYDESGRLTDIIDSCGRLLQLSYDRHGRIAALTAPHPDEEDQRFVVMQYAYDSAGNLVQTIDALGQPATYGYDRHLLVKETDRNGLSFHFKYDRHDEHAKCLRTWGDGGIYDHKLSYDDEQGLTVVANSLGYKTQYFHDGALVTKIIDARGGVTEYEYNEHYQRLKATDPIGAVTTWSYDERGSVSTIVGPEKGTVSITCGPWDRPVELTDSVGGVWLWKHDDRGRVVERRDPLGAVVQLTFNGPHLATLIDAAGQPTSFEYAASRLLTEMRMPDGGVTRWRYDRLGRPVVIIDAHGNERRVHYDLAGRRTRTEESSGNVKERRFDGEGRVTRFRDLEHDVAFTYQGTGRLATRTEGRATVHFEYDTEEHLVAISNELGYVYSFVLDPTGEVEEERGFDGAMRVFERDAAGRIRRATTSGSFESTYARDKAGRVTLVEHFRRARGARAALAAGAEGAEGANPEDVTLEPVGRSTFAYRKDGDLIQATNDFASVKIERDLLGRIVRETQGKHVVATSYDKAGRRSRIESSLGADIVIGRNAMGDAQSVSSNTFVAQFTRDLMGREVERQLPGGVRSRWRRDSLGRPLEHEIIAGQQPIHARSYRWDQADRLQQVIDVLRGPTTHGYDDLGNLASATYGDGDRELRVPDAAGNLFRTEQRDDRKYGPAGQLIESTDRKGRTTRYNYDAIGNLTEKREGSGRVWQYRWGPDGTLREVERPDATVVRFEYDALGRRIAKHFRGLTTRWVWDGNAPLHEWVDGKLEPIREPAAVPLWSAEIDIRRREDELTQHLTRGPPIRGSVDQPITWLFEPERYAPIGKLSAAGTFSIICDHNAAPVVMLDDAGSAVFSAELSIYGEPRRVEGDRLSCPFRWAGQYEDAETGLYYNRFRYYDPESGEYTSQDPIGLRGGLGLYRYTHDPARFSDPLGLVHEDTPGHSVYVIVDKNTQEPIYVGQTNDVEGRQAEHQRSGRFDPDQHRMVTVVDDVSHGEARGAEQALMEDLGTKEKGRRGTFPANVVDSVSADRLDNPSNPREQAFSDAYDRHKGVTVDDARAKIAKACS